jgi:CheY-like chemotaxis protein
MDGSIDVETAPNEGTKFTVSLAFRLSDETAHNDISKEKQVDLAGTKILLVEDNEINSEIAVMILSQAGCIVETAENGLVAVNMVKDNPADTFDIVLMDIQMPVMDGYTATAEIRALDDETKASVPIVAMTANAFKEDEKAALDSGMQGYISKPLDVEKMLYTISDIYSARSKGDN